METQKLQVALTSLHNLQQKTNKKKRPTVIIKGNKKITNVDI